MIIVSMANPEELDGRRMALWLVDGDDDWLVAGTAHRQGRELVFEYQGKPLLPIGPDLLERVEAVLDEDLRRDVLLGAEYLLKLRIGPLPGQVDQADLQPTGLRIADGQISFGDPEST